MAPRKYAPDDQYLKQININIPIKIPRDTSQKIHINSTLYNDKSYLK